MRLDGTITHLSERDQRMKKFHSDDRYSVFLLTTQVCIVCDICFINSTSINLPNISDKKKIYYIYRIMSILKVETDIITSNAASLVGPDVIIVFIGDVIMCLMICWPIISKSESIC